ncbi:MAG: hypothetical protein AABW51_02970 [Nanoarchaeota archaeon]
MATQEPRIVRGRVELIVPYQKGEVAFAHPFFGANTYRNVGQEILSKGQLIPTGDQMASFIHSAYCSELKDEPEFKEVRDIMRSNWFWVFNRNLWTKDGFYVVQDPKAIGRSQPLDQNELEKMLSDSKEINGVSFSRDNKVRFAPISTYDLETNGYKALAKNGVVIANYGAEGAEKLSEVSSTFKGKPYVYGLKTQTPEQRVSALDGDRYFGNGLVVDGSFDDSRFGRGVGVLHSEKSK